MFKANGLYKYGIGLLETVLQTEILPRSLARAVTYNRFVNTQGRHGTNIPLDLQLEHENRMYRYKAELVTYGGENECISAD